MERGCDADPYRPSSDTGYRRHPGELDRAGWPPNRLGWASFRANDNPARDSESFTESLFRLESGAAAGFELRKGPT